MYVVIGASERSAVSYRGLEEITLGHRFCFLALN